jgi:hypothetical protein
MARLAKLVTLGVAAWFLRWAAEEVAAYSGRNWQPPGSPPRESVRKPGWLPGPSAETLRKFSEP